MWEMLAQVQQQLNGADSVWLNFIVQLGSFGLIAYFVILGAPKWARDQREERKEAIMWYERMLNNQQIAFGERNALLVQAISAQADSWRTKLTEVKDEIHEAVEKLADTKENKK